MTNFFSKKEETEVSQLEIKNLKKEIERLQSKTQAVHYHFHIDHIQVDHIDFDRLLFQLESMHTEHLNGTLNFGNNFCDAKSKPLHASLKQNHLSSDSDKKQTAPKSEVHFRLRSRGETKK